MLLEGIPVWKGRKGRVYRFALAVGIIGFEMGAFRPGLAVDIGGYVPCIRHGHDRSGVNRTKRHVGMNETCRGDEPVHAGAFIVAIRSPKWRILIASCFALLAIALSLA